jgi:hypothetical protein
MMVVYSKSTKGRGVCGATRWRWIEADTARAMNVGETSVDRELTAGVSITRCDACEYCMSRSGRTNNTRSMGRLCRMIDHPASLIPHQSLAKHGFTTPPQSIPSHPILTRSLLQLLPSRSHPKLNCDERHMRSFLLEAHCKGAHKPSSIGILYGCRAFRRFRVNPDVRDGRFTRPTVADECLGVLLYEYCPPVWVHPHSSNHLPQFHHTSITPSSKATLPLHTPPCLS